MLRRELVGVVVGLSDLPPDRLAAWVEASCAAQGVPSRLTDPALLGRVVVLLGDSAEAARARARSASTRTLAVRSQAPDGLHSVGVQGAGSYGARADDGVVEHGGDDGVPPVKVEGVPLDT